eukprot:7379142-Ditylum_brightwellii.AAC.1
MDWVLVVDNGPGGLCLSNRIQHSRHGACSRGVYQKGAQLTDITGGDGRRNKFGDTGRRDKGHGAADFMKKARKCSSGTVLCFPQTVRLVLSLE